MTPIPLDEILRETLPAAWAADGRRHDRAYLDVCDCRVWVARRPAGPPEHALAVHVVEGDDQVMFAGRRSAALDIIDAVVECVRRAVQVERPVRATDVPSWAHAEVVKAQGSIMRSGPPWALYEALVREIGEVTP